MCSMLSLAAIALAGTNPDAAFHVYVGTYATGAEQGIYLLDFDADTGQLVLKGRACEAESPSFLAPHPSQPLLYAVAEAAQPEGSVGAYRINEDTGLLTLINEQASKGGAPCHISVAPSGRHVAVANYVSGTVALFPIGEDGALDEASAVIQHHGSGAHPQRQVGPHAHSVNFDSTGRFLYAADLGLDRVLIYRYDPARGTLSPESPLAAAAAPGAGPRHLAFHPSGRFAYVVNELSSTVSVFACDPDTGALQPLESVSTLPKGYAEPNTTAEIRVHPSGRFLYVSNRGHDSIAVFVIDDTRGTITPLGHTPSGGKTPRNFNIDPTGRYLLAANQASDNVVVFRIDPDRGTLAPTGQSVSVPAPVCVVFSPREENLSQVK